MLKNLWIVVMILIMIMPTMAVVAQDNGNGEDMEEEMMSDDAASADETTYGEILVVTAADGVNLRADGNGDAEGGGEIIGREPYGNSVATADPGDHIAPEGFGCAGDFIYVDVDTVDEDNDLGWICSDHLSALADMVAEAEEPAMDDEAALEEMMAEDDEMAAEDEMAMEEDPYGDTLYVTAADGVNLRADGNGDAEGGGEVIGREPYGNSVATADPGDHTAPEGFGCAGEFTYVDVDIDDDDNDLGWICSDHLSDVNPAAMMAAADDAGDDADDSASDDAGEGDDASENGDE